MTSDHWPTIFTARAVQAMREARQAVGLTMADVAQGCADRGHPEIKEQTIKNLETGRRASMTIADFVVLADVLGVPPVSLLFPLGTDATVEVLPGREVSTWDALAWFTGETPTDQPAPRAPPATCSTSSAATATSSPPPRPLTPWPRSVGAKPAPPWTATAEPPSWTAQPAMRSTPSKTARICVPSVPGCASGISYLRPSLTTSHSSTSPKPRPAQRTARSERNHDPAVLLPRPPDRGKQWHDLHEVRWQTPRCLRRAPRSADRQDGTRCE